ncbi:MAG: DUF4932 domain-containing protein, partial [Planctomycetota bacterium]
LVVLGVTGQAHVAEQANHPVVELARELRRRRGVSFDAVMSLAVHLEDIESLELAIPLDPWPPRLDERWQPADIERFLSLAKDFIEKTNYRDFLATHEALFEKAAARLTERLKERDFLGWFNGFFGERDGAEFFVIVGMLNGGANYGVSRRGGEKPEVISPVIGASRFDERGVPVFDASMRDLIVHELCHSYTNPIVDRFADVLLPSAERMFPFCQEVMSRQAYKNPRTVLFESFVRAAVIRFLADTEGVPAAMRESAQQAGLGFDWAADLANLYATFARSREEHPTFEDFVPQIAEFFERYSQSYAERMARAPRVVSLVPENGAEDVAPELSNIVITFDRPMRDGAWSMLKTGEPFPEIVGKIHFDAERQVLTVPVRLEPATRYVYRLNGPGYLSFRSEEGLPLAPMEVAFRTK